MESKKFASFDATDKKKIIHFYVFETKPHCLDDKSSDFDWKPELWDLGRLFNLFKKSSFLLPKLIKQEKIGLKFSELDNHVEAWLYVLAHSETYLIVCIEIEFMSDLTELISVQEDLYYGRQLCDGIEFKDRVIDIFSSLKTFPRPDFFDDIQKNYHQIVVLSKDMITRDIDTDLAQKLIYRADLPAREGMSTICYPVELNRRFETMCAMGPFVTVLGKQQGYIVYSIAFSVLLITSLKQKVSEIRELVFHHLKTLQANKALTSGQMRKTIAEINGLRLRLNSEIESYHMIGAFIPAMRVEDYHFNLWSQSQLNERIISTKELLDKAQDYIELTHISREELQKEEEKISKESWSLVVALLSVLAIPPSIIFGYLGAQISELEKRASLFDVDKFGAVYISVFLITFFILAIGFLVSLIRKRDFRKKSSID